METVSIGYCREDGDFVILATLNNNHGNMANSSFHELVKGLRESITARVCNPSIEIQIIERQDTPDCVDVGNQPEGAAKPREAPQGEVGRSEREIVEQTEKLASMIFCFAFNSGLAGSYRNSENPRAQSCWRMACEIQAMLTDTDAENAAQEIESEPDKGDRQSRSASDADQSVHKETAADSDAEFKNFHRQLCTEFGYTHDEKDWKRDQLSLIEWIRKFVNSSGQFVIYSPSESAASGDGAGFWNNHSGWTTFDGATHFTIDEAGRLNFPISTGNDARWIKKAEASMYYAESNLEGQGAQQSALKNYVVLYRVDSIMSDHDDPFGFQCYADDPEHATGQCLDAYPGCDVVWVWQGPTGVGMKPALDEYWASKQVSDDEVICPHCGEKSHIGGLIGPLANQCPKCGKQCDGQKPNPITSFNLVMPTLDEMDQYDAVEVHPVESTIGKDGEVICEVIEEEQIYSNPLASYSWSVYLHLKEGGTDVAGDFPTKELADAFAAFVDLALVHAAQVAKT